MLNPGDDIYGVYDMYPYSQPRKIRVSATESLTGAELKMTANKEKWTIDNTTASECSNAILML